MAATGEKRYDVQGLRALAVLLVVGDHVGLGLLSGGYVGVDVFFVISGFLISSLLFQELQSSGRIGLAGFYARRARRILPAATVCLAVTLGVAALTLTLPRVEELAADSRWAAFFLANVHFAAQGQSYSDESDVDSAVQHYWSLAVEEQFYLVWPALLAVLGLLLLRRRGRAFPRRLLAGLAATIFVVSLAWSVWHTAHDPQPAYFSTTARAWELATGALLALLGTRLAGIGTALRTILVLGGLAAIGVAAVAYDTGTPFPGWQALVPVLGTVAVIAGGTGGRHPGAARLLTARPATWIGDLSYSLYLWHWPVIVLGPELLPAATDGAAGILLLVAVSLALAWLSHRFVEAPFRHRRLPVVSHGRGVLLLWPAAVGAVLAVAVAAPAVGEHRLGSAREQAAAYYEDVRFVDAASLRTVDGVQRALRQMLELADTGAPIPPELVNPRAGDLWQRTYDCWADWPDTSVDLCPVGDPDGTRTVVLYGDSHAGAWLPALDEIGQARQLRVLPLVKLGCAPFDVAQLEHGTAFPECEAFRRWAEQQIDELDPALVVLSYRGLFSLAKLPGELRDDSWRRGVDSALSRLAGKHRVAVLSDFPAAPFRPRHCRNDVEKNLAGCLVTAGGRDELADVAVREAAARLQVPFVDVRLLLCADDRCPIVVGEVASYADRSHPTVTWARRTAAALGELLPVELTSAAPAP